MIKINQFNIHTNISDIPYGKLLDFQELEKVYLNECVELSKKAEDIRKLHTGQLNQQKQFDKKIAKYEAMKMTDRQAVNYVKAKAKLKEIKESLTSYELQVDELNNDSKPAEALCKALQVFVPNADEMFIGDGFSALIQDVDQIYKDDITLMKLYAHYTGLFTLYFDKTVADSVNALTEEDLKKDKSLAAIVAVLVNGQSMEDRAKACLIYAEKYGGCKVVDSDYHFYHNGQWYYLDADKTERYFVGKQITTGEVVEVKEFQRELNLKMEAGQIDNSVLEFSLSLQMLAILCRKKNEIVPSDPEFRKQWQSKRMKEFADITCDVIYNVSFFLRYILVPGILRRNINTFGADLSKKSPMA